MKKLVLLLMTFILILCAACSDFVSGNSGAPDSMPFIENSIVFYFSSGAGAWRTEVTVNADGTFSGCYQDSDMGDVSGGYPNGTRYECYFNGEFTDIQKVNDYEYSMKMDDLNINGAVGEERIEDGVRVVVSEPYGFDDADAFFLYLPGRPTEDLPGAFIGWVGPVAWSDTPAALPFFGLYNVGGGQGFRSEL
jgi:hypothetical protein